MHILTWTLVRYRLPVDAALIPFRRSVAGVGMGPRALCSGAFVLTPLDFENLAMTVNFGVESALPGNQVLGLPQLSRRFLALQRVILSIYLVLTDAVALAVAFRLAYWIRFELQLTVAPEVTGDPEDYMDAGGRADPAVAARVHAVQSLRSALPAGGDRRISQGLSCLHDGDDARDRRHVRISRVRHRAGLADFPLDAVVRVRRRQSLAGAPGGLRLSPPRVSGDAVSDRRDQSRGGQSRVLLVRVGFVWRLDGRVRHHESNGTPGPLSRPILGSTREIRRIVETYGIEDLIVAITGSSREELLTLCEEVDSLPVQLRVSSGVYELLTTRVSVQTLGTVPVMTVHKNRLERSELVIKTVLEVSLSLLALLLLSPLLLAIALLIKLDSRGPMIYRRRVLGASGQQFDAFKFRTMHVNGDALLNGQPQAAEELRTNHKLKDDPRVTRVGRWLRKFSLDELPQLVNVLLGQMSLVGPRMITEPEAAKYGRHRLNLLAVKPGITGLWQVSGRSDLSYEERVRIDMYYVRNYSVWLDLQILFIETIPAVLRGRGAY
jgi:lipopolysaccharide/colanic/teichoic acid biosynthesis glycosyltransferase